VLAILRLNVTLCQPKPILEPKTKSPCMKIQGYLVLGFFGQFWTSRTGRCGLEPHRDSKRKIKQRRESDNLSKTKSPCMKILFLLTKKANPIK